MNTFTRISVPLSQEEYAALRDAAGREYRHLREHARWLLHQALRLNHPEETHNRGAEVDETQHAAVMP